MQTKKQYNSTTSTRKQRGRPVKSGTSPFPLVIDPEIKSRLKKMALELDVSTNRLIIWMINDGMKLGVKGWENRCHQLYLDDLEEKKEAIEKELEMAGRTNKGNLAIDGVNGAGTLASSHDQLQFPLGPQPSIN